jgi:3-isopropylmalate/(R)-2-methylmalate dehydratase small subunit
LPILECEAAAEGIDMGDTVEVDFNTGLITNKTKNETYQAEPFPEFMQEMFKVGGLVEQTKVKLGLK